MDLSLKSNTNNDKYAIEDNFSLYWKLSYQIY